MDTVSAARERALRYLAVREHARQELAQKLRALDIAPAVIATVLDQLEQENILSEQRFMESFLRSRVQKGYGWLHIQQALKQRGIGADSLQMLDIESVDWNEQARKVRLKRFGANSPKQPAEKAKQVRFLQSRGFTGGQIRAALSGVDAGDELA